MAALVDQGIQPGSRDPWLTQPVHRVGVGTLARAERCLAQLVDLRLQETVEGAAVILLVVAQLIDTVDQDVAIALQAGEQLGAALANLGVQPVRTTPGLAQNAVCLLAGLGVQLLGARLGLTVQLIGARTRLVIELLGAGPGFGGGALGLTTASVIRR